MTHVAVVGIIWEHKHHYWRWRHQRYTHKHVTHTHTSHTPRSAVKCRTFSWDKRHEWNCVYVCLSVRKQDIIKVTEQLIEAISNGDFESYTYVTSTCTTYIHLSTELDSYFESLPLLQQNVRPGCDSVWAWGIGESCRRPWLPPLLFWKPWVDHASCLIDFVFGVWVTWSPLSIYGCWQDHLSCLITQSPS